MTERPVSLAARRAETKQDSTLWSPEDCLRDALARVQDTARPKVTKLIVLCVEEDSPVLHYSLSNFTTPDLVGYLNNMLFEVLLDWRGINQ